MLCLAAGCGDAPAGTVGVARGALVAECAPQALPEGAWLCPEPLIVECGAAPDVLYVSAADDACDDLSPSDPGPFPPGVHTVTVDDASGDAVCSAELTVQDTVAPNVVEHTIHLWPPNHKLHAIQVSDCVSVTDACEPELQGEFVWASSDEPINDIGDGNHEPDIVFGDCQNVMVRAERQGPRDGRVYRLGVRAVDSSGNEVEGACTVLVDHDQRGVDAADSGDAYRIELDGSGETPACDGVDEPPPPAETPGGDGDGDAPGDGDGDAPGGDGDGDAPGDGDGVGDPTPLPDGDGPT